MRGRLLVAVAAASLAGASSAVAASFPSPQLVKRLADRSLVVTPARPGDHPRVTLRRVIAELRRMGVAPRKPYLVYALRLTDTEYTDHGRPVIDGRLVWLFVLPHVRFPIFGTCRHNCTYYADAAMAVDANSGKWLFSVSLGP